MSNLVDPTKTKTFEEKMFERIRESIGDLMTEEDLKNVVEKSLDKAFFEQRLIKGTGWHDKDRYIESKFMEMFSVLMQPMLHKAVEQYIRDHEEELKKKVDEMILSKADDFVVKALGNLLFPHMHMAMHSIVQTAVDSKPT